MKLLLPFKVGDIVRTNYETGPYRIVEAKGGCTCANYVDVINNHDKAKRREPHWHFVLINANEQPTKTGTYHESKYSYLSGFVYRNGECVAVDGPYEPWQSGWHEEDDGLDKIKLVKLAPIQFVKQPTRREKRQTNGVRTNEK